MVRLGRGRERTHRRRCKTLLTLSAMTEFDKQLVEAAKRLSIWDYRKIDKLIKIAETEQGREELGSIRMDYFDYVQDTL